MSDFDSENEETPTEEPGFLRKQIQEQAAKAREAEARAAAAERELAFAKAGLPLSDPKMEYFVKGYDGDLTPEVIKAAAEAAGFLAPAAPEIPADELVQHQQAAVLAGSGTVTPPDENAEYLAALGQARTKADVLAVMDRFGSTRTSNL